MLLGVIERGQPTRLQLESHPAFAEFLVSFRQACVTATPSVSEHPVRAY